MEVPSSTVYHLGMRYRNSDAWWDFQVRVEELGGVVTEPSWLGAKNRHSVRCSAGHSSSVAPTNVKGGWGICRICSGRDSATAENNFHSRVSELGGEVLEQKWLGSSEPHRVRCAEGHVSGIRPNNVQQGEGICRLCMGKVWDAVYVVTNGYAVKFGITSGDPRSRLNQHARNGYTTVLYVRRDLTDGLALAAEQGAIRRLRERGVRPVRGREYFDRVHVAFILNVLDEYLR